MNETLNPTAFVRPVVYTLVAYRPNGVDTCRNCVMGRSDSDFSLHTFTSPDELVKAWAKLKLESAGTPREYCSVEFTLLIDGLDYHNWWSVYDEAYDRGEVVEPPYDQLESAASEQLQVLQGEAQERERLRKEEAARLEVLADLKRRREQAEAERATYERLHSKYGTGKGSGA